MLLSIGVYITERILYLTCCPGIKFDTCEVIYLWCTPDALTTHGLWLFDQSCHLVMRVTIHITRTSSKLELPSLDLLQLIFCKFYRSYYHHTGWNLYKGLYMDKFKIGCNIDSHIWLRFNSQVMLKPYICLLLLRMWQTLHFPVCVRVICIIFLFRDTGHLGFRKKWAY